MTDGAGLERELGEFFGELRAAVEAGEERRLGREAGIQQELTEFLAGLPSEVNVEEERRRALDPGLQRELGEFFGGLSPVVRAEEERQRRAAGDLERNLTGMFGLLEPTIAAATVAIRVMEERAREEQDRRTGRRFSAFDLVRTQELDLSRIFRGLLDPSGDHSQGDLFLSLLLEELTVASGHAAELLRGVQPSANCRAHLEYTVSDQAVLPGQQIAGSIDIVLELEDNFWIGIENKPSALDQPWQVDRYLFALAHEVEQRGGSEEQVVLLYWSGDGTDPDLRDLQELADPFWDQTQRERQERLRSRCLTMPYGKRFGVASVEGWLKRCRIECETERVRSFLLELMDYIQRHFRNSGVERIQEREYV